jgi:hypothetical protein
MKRSYAAELKKICQVFSPEQIFFNSARTAGPVKQSGIS